MIANVDRACRDQEVAALGHGVAGIDREIEDDEFKLGAITPDRADARVEIDIAFDLRADAGAQQFLHPVDQVVHVDRLDRQALHARKSKELAGELGAADHALARIGGPALDLVDLVGFALDQLDIARNCLEQIVEIMRDTAGQLANRVDLLRLDQGSFGAFALRDFGLQLRQRLVALVDPLRQSGVCHLQLRRGRNRQRMGD